jgi:hypothetical protein
MTEWLPKEKLLLISLKYFLLFQRALNRGDITILVSALPPQREQLELRATRPSPPAAGGDVDDVDVEVDAAMNVFADDRDDDHE